MHIDTETQQFGDQAHTAVSINVSLFKSYHCILTTVMQTLDTHESHNVSGNINYNYIGHWPMGTSATYTMLIILRDKSRGYLFFEK